MIEYHVKQFDGGATACDGRNCAAATDAMNIYYGTGGKVKLTADQVRTQSGVSCIPGAHSPSGGLFIGDVIRVAELHHVRVDFGQGIGDLPPYRRWPVSEARARCSGPYGMHVLGDYDQIKAPVRAPGSTFMGDHSAFAHDFRLKDKSYCWHDPLRSAPTRIPEAMLLAYWQKPTSPVRGLAGFTRIPVTSKYAVLIAPRARIRIYGFKHPPSGPINCIESWEKPDIVWGNKASSAPCGPAVFRRTCDGRSSATTAEVLEGRFKGSHIRIAERYGTTHIEL